MVCLQTRITAKCHVHLQTLTKHLQSFKKISLTLGVDLQDTPALSPKMTKSEMQKKWTKLILRISAKLYAQFQALTKTPAKYKKDRGKTVGGVAFTRYQVFKCFKPQK